MRTWLFSNSLLSAMLAIFVASWFVQSLTGLDELDAYQLVSQAGQAPVGNVCDTNYTMVAKIPKTYLKTPEAYGSTHARLRALGEEYLAR